MYGYLTHCLLSSLTALLLLQAQAEARQEQFAGSAVGRAAYTAVKKAKEQDAKQANSSDQMNKDWLT